MASNTGVVVETASGLIVNRIMWSDEAAAMDFGAGLAAVQEPDDEDYAIGGTLIDGVYTVPPPPETKPAPETKRKRK